MVPVLLASVHSLRMSSPTGGDAVAMLEALQMHTDLVMTVSEMVRAAERKLIQPWFKLGMTVHPYNLKA